VQNAPSNSSLHLAHARLAKNLLSLAMLGGCDVQKMCVRVSRALGNELARFLGSAALEHSVKRESKQSDWK